MKRAFLLAGMILAAVYSGDASAQWISDGATVPTEKREWLSNKLFKQIDYKQHPLFQAFKRYETEYWKLDAQCAREVPRGTMALINMTHCIWRKDRILMSKYELDHLIFDTAAERYEKNFQLAKTTSIQALDGNSQALIDAYVKNKVYSDNDYLRLQESEIKRWIKK